MLVGIPLFHIRIVGRELTYLHPTTIKSVLEAVMPTGRENKLKLLYTVTNIFPGTVSMGTQYRSGNQHHTGCLKKVQLTT